MADIQIVPLVHFAGGVETDAGYVVKIDGKPYTPDSALTFAQQIRDAVAREDRKRVLAAHPSGSEP